MKTPQYTLRGSLRSPFTRIVRLFMITNEIDFEFEIVNYLFVKEDEEALAKESPINKIPVMYDGSQKIFDSRVMINHLIKENGLEWLSLEEENIVSAAYSLLDTTVNLYLLKRDGFDLSNPTWFLKRQLDRIPSNLAYVIPWMSRLDPVKASDWNYPAISLYSYLYFAKAIEMLDISKYPECETFLEDFKNARGVHETDFLRK